MPYASNYKRRTAARRKYKKDVEYRNKVRDQQREYRAKTGIDRESYKKRREKILAQKKEYYKRKKEREFRKLLTDLKYDREHPNRRREYYLKRKLTITEAEKEANRIKKRAWYAENKDKLNKNKRARYKKNKAKRFKDTGENLQLSG